MAAASAPAAARRCGGASSWLALRLSGGDGSSVSSSSGGEPMRRCERERVCHASTPASRASHTLTGRAAQALCAARGKGKCREGEGITARARHRTLGATRIDGQLLVAVPAPSVLSDVELCRLAPRARRQSSTHLRPGGCRLYYDAYIWDGVKWWGGARGSAGETPYIRGTFACVSRSPA